MKLPVPADPSILATELVAARARSARITADLRDERLLGPRLAIVNPPLWEIGHVAWFQEHWCLRYRETGMLGASMLPMADALYDSAKVAHDTRWDLPLPSLDARAATNPMFSIACCAGWNANRRTPRCSISCSWRFFTRTCTPKPSTTRGRRWAMPIRFLTPARRPKRSNMFAETPNFPAGPFALGAVPEDGFVFDNEKWAHEVQVAPFRIARAAVTNAEYLEFVAAGGYLRREWWSDEGWTWRAAAGLQAPRYWIRQDDSWWLRRFDRTVPLPARSSRRSRQLARGAGLVPLRASPPADRSRVGIRGGVSQ